MIEFSVTKKIRGYSPRYDQNCKNSDFLNISASISFVSISVQHYARCEIRFFVTKSNLTLNEHCRELKFEYGNGVMSRDKVRKKVREFKEGRVDVHDFWSPAWQRPPECRTF